MAIDATGRASAAWNTTQTFASAQQADGTWAAAATYPGGGLGLAVDSTSTGQLLWSGSGQALAATLPPGGSWGPATTVLPGSSLTNVVLAPSGANVFAGWWDTGNSTINAAVHTSAGWGTATKVASLGSGAFVAALGNAQAGNGAVMAWISGTSATGVIQASIATSP